MKCSLRMMGSLGAAVTALSGFGDVLITNTWDTAKCPGGNTPITAYDWSDTGNWTTAAGVPNAYNATAVIGKPTTAPRFIDLGTGVKISYLNAKGTSAQANGGNYYLGDVRVGATANSRAIMGTGGDYFFGNVYQTGYNGSFGYVNGSIAGHFDGSLRDPETGYNRDSNWAIASGSLTIRCDWFADSADPDRPSPLNITGYSTSQGSFFFYGPKGADDQTSDWKLTDGSPYLQYAGEGAHTVVPGTHVTGEGIPSGTFVRYVFASTGWIALSQPVSGSAGVKTLSFGAITPKVSATMSMLNLGANNTVSAVKYREQDGCSLTIRDLNAGADYVIVGTADATLIPGDIQINKIGDKGTAAAQVRLQNSRIVFASSYATPKSPAFTIDSAYTSRITVKDGVDTVISTFESLKGTVDKRGEGSLTINLTTAATSGTVKATEGRLVLTKDASLGAAELSIAKVEVGAGASLKIPEEGLQVSDLTVGEGATIEGPGTLRIPRALTASVKLTGGVSVICPSEADLIDANHPWFDLDATDFGTAKMETLVENGTNFVTKWYDSCGNGQFAKRRNTAAVDSSNYPDGSGYCWIRENLHNGMPYVDMGPFYCSNRDASDPSNKGDGRLYGPDRSLAFCDAAGTAFKMGDSSTSGTARPALTAAFFAVGSENGGGTLLGAGGSNYGSYGIVHGYKDGYREAHAPIWCHQDAGYDTNQLRARFTDTALASGTAIFRVNGTTCQPATTSFSGGFDVMTVKAPAGYESNLNGGCIGYFGQYTVHRKYESNCGGLQLGEVLLLTNAVSAAQITAIENHLRYKWRGEKIAGYHTVVQSFRLADGATYSAQVVSAEEAGGAGTLTGDFELTGGFFDIACDANGEFPAAFVVNGKATVPGEVTVRIDASAAAKLSPGTYTILSAANLVCPDFSWTATGPRNRSYALTRDGNQIKLTVSSNGLLLIFR